MKLATMPSKLMTLRILVADDHAVVRRGLRSLLGAHPGWEVIDEASDGAEAVDKSSQLIPDIVVLDISMPKMSGLEACRQIRRNNPQSEVLIVTQHDSKQMMREAGDAGARGYVIKSNIARDLVKAVQATSEHKPFGWKTDPLNHSN
ncbi:MAG: response regulator transcription factor [Terriglobales bacterium]|jgi:DNA-binding NarL/FixJ family response regulator